jgi:DNA repair exonuclease SbcCD ATPase subunit
LTLSLSRPDLGARFRGTAESTWNWDACGVPVGLTEEMIRNQKEKEKEKRKKAKQRKKEEKLTAPSHSEEAVAPGPMSEHQFREGISLLERRAREEAGVCPVCEKSLYGLVSYDLYDHKCCSSTCVMTLRRRLAAEAAEKRMANK